MVKKRVAYITNLFFFKYITLQVLTTYIQCYLFNKNYILCIFFKNNPKIDQYNFTYKFKTAVLLNDFISTSFLQVWEKIIFKGKSYKLKVIKHKPKLTLRLGYSH